MEATSRTAIYAEMLSLQTRLQFPFEQHFYASSRWKDARTVLDFGSGNAAYAATLDSRYPGKTYFCVEADPEMRKVAEMRSAPNRNTVASLEAIPPDTIFDFILLRLVLLHVADRQQVYRAIVARSAPAAQLLVFDAEDDLLAFDPVPAEFVGALTRLRSQSKNRNLRSVLPDELAAHDFVVRYEDSIVVNNAFPHAREDLFKYMYRTAELGVGSPLPEVISRELIDWWLSEPYVQYGFFGQLYERRREAQ